MPTSLSAPVLWPHPQWMSSCDSLDFGRVRPGECVQRAFVVANVGAGAASLAASLRCSAPWLELRAGEGAPWSRDVALSLQAGDETLLLCRANSTQIAGNWGGQDAFIEISSLGTDVPNAPDSQLNAQGQLQLAPIRAGAYFLEPRFLRWETASITDASQTTKIAAAPPAAGTGRGEIEIHSAAVPLGTSPRVALKLRRSDALPTRAEMGLIALKNGREQWFDCQLLQRGDEQTLELTFYTANREPGKTHSIELEVRDADDLVEPAKVRWNLSVTRPPLLAFEAVHARAVPNVVTPKTIELKNGGEGELRIDSVAVPGQHQRWLTLLPVQTPFAIAAGATHSLSIEVSGRFLQPNQQHHGCLEVSCNHAGRRVLRRLPVYAIAPPHAVRIEINELDLQAVLTQGTSSSFPIRVSNDAAQEARLRLVACDAANPSESASWVSCEPNRINLTPGGQVEATVFLNSQGMTPPEKGASVAKNGYLFALLVEPDGEKQIWSREFSLRVQPRPKRFGLF